MSVPRSYRLLDVCTMSVPRTYTELEVCSSRPSQALRDPQRFRQIGRYYCSQTPAVTENMEGTKKQEKPLQAKIQDPPSNF